MSRLLFGFCLFAFTVGCAHSGPPYAGWRTVKSEHFTLHTELGDSTSGEVLRDLEGLHAALHNALFPTTDLSGIEVFLFRDPEATRQAAKRAQPGGSSPKLRERPMLLTSRPDYRNAKKVSQYSTQHEEQAAQDLVRRFMKQNMPKAPTWFSVGIEQYVETVEIQGDLARFGHRTVRLTAEINRGKVIPLSKLIEADQKEFNGGNWRLSYQASAWAFIHFLLGHNNGEYRKAFDVMAGAIIDSNRGTASASRAAIEKAFPDIPFETLELQVRDYAVNDLGRRPAFESFTITLPKTPDAPYASTSADPTRIQAFLLDLKKRGGGK